MAQEGYVQVAVDGSGKQIRNVVVQRMLPDGTIVTEYMQVVSLRDENGDPLDSTFNRALLLGIFQQLDEIRRMYATATSQASSAPQLPPI